MLKILNSLVFTGIFLFINHAGAQKPEETSDPFFQIIDQSPVFSKIFTGFALFDPEKAAFIYQKDSDKYFTPASNTKIFTFYTALKVLGDEMAVLRYIIRHDSLIFWGTGAPLFLHPEFPEDSMLLNFLKNRPERLFFSGHNFRDERFGPAWSWSDYKYSYQVEKSPFPIYGNTVRFERKKLQEGFSVHPIRFSRNIVYNPKLEEGRPFLQRREHENVFEYNAGALTGTPFEQTVPFRYSPETVARLLSDALGRPVAVLDLTQVEPEDANTLSVPVPDTLYRRLMYDSDNFIAEQLLLMCSEKLSGILKTEEAIDYAIDSLFAGAPDKLVWHDGSGLSRYNLFTPRTIVYALHQIYLEKPSDWLLATFAAGGRSGTIQDWYRGKKGQPYVFAKTGTLSNKHCLSGYIVTKRNKVLIFSFMLNNYVNGTGELKKEMERVLEWIYERY